jgi:hypothetical protein
MTLPSLAPIVELEKRLGKNLDGADEDRANALLVDASALVRHVARATWVDADGTLTEVPDVAVAITLQATLRAWYNPEGVNGESIAGYSVQYGAGDVWLTSTERNQLEQLGRAGGFAAVEASHGYGFDGPAQLTTPVDYQPGQGWPLVGFETK